VDAGEGDGPEVARDLNVAGAMLDYAPTVTASDGFADLSGSDLVVVTAAGERVAEEVRDRAPDSTIVVVADPVEPQCHSVYDVALFPRERVVGVAASIHSAAFRIALARELGVSVRDISAVVLGGLGRMVPVLSCATVAGVPIRRRIPAERLDEIAGRFRDRDQPRVQDLSPAYGTAAAVGEAVDAILLDQHRVLPCAALCKGEYGFEEVFVSLPLRLAAGGIDDIVEMDLDDDERTQLAESARAVEQAVA
jgi:malate dehydrogenase